MVIPAAAQPKALKMDDRNRIDFVLPWVDGSDPLWRAQMESFRTGTPPYGEVRTGGNTCDNTDVGPETGAAGQVPAAYLSGEDSSEERYRDWDTLRYWFRAVERFAPWAGHVHLLTWGHLPEWLDRSHPDLRIVRHEDFIPPEYLPTFNSCPIELNMHRIEGLSERFVYFNDDIFLCRPVPSERFFRGGLPCDAARLGVMRGEPVEHIMLNCLAVINRRHGKRAVIAGSPGKWFNRRYSTGDMARTLSLLPWSFFTGIHDYHMPQPFLKETFRHMWNEEHDALDAACRHRFRSPLDLSQWLMRYEQICRGDFAPTGMRDTKLMTLGDGNTGLVRETLLSGRYSMVCLNDNNSIRNTEAVRQSLVDAMQRLLPEPSRYEL